MLELAANVNLPETLRFLNPGWFILHLCAIPLVFLIGMAIGRKGTSYGTTPATGTSPGFGAGMGRA